MADVLPGSISTTSRVAAAMVVVGGALCIFEMVAVAGYSEEWLPFCFLGPPALAWTFAIGYFAQQKGWSAFGALATGTVVQALGGFFYAVVTNSGSSGNVLGPVLAITAVMVLVTSVVVAPLAVAASIIGHRRDLAAGDAMLGFGGVWLLTLQMLVLALAGTSAYHHSEHLVSLFTIFGMVIGLGAFGVYFARGAERRRFRRSIVRGELAGWRIREGASEDEIATLPALLGGGDGEIAVVERIEMGGVLYRSGIVGQPLATMRIKPRAVTP